MRKICYCLTLHVHNFVHKVIPLINILTLKMIFAWYCCSPTLKWWILWRFMLLSRGTIVYPLHTHTQLQVSQNRTKCVPHQEHSIWLKKKTSSQNSHLIRQRGNFKILLLLYWEYEISVLISWMWGTEANFELFFKTKYINLTITTVK